MNSSDSGIEISPSTNGICYPASFGTCATAACAIAFSMPVPVMMPVKAPAANRMPVAKRLVAEFDGSFGELARFVDGRSGRITVAALPSVAAVLLPGALARLKAECPDVEVIILDGLSGSITEAVASGRAEFGLAVQSPQPGILACQLLLTDQFGLVCRTDDPLARVKGKLTWSIFADRDFIAMAPASSVRQMTDAAFLRCGLAVRQNDECAFLGTTGHLVERGLGITALPRRDRSLTPATARLINLLTEEASKR